MVRKASNVPGLKRTPISSQKGKKLAQGQAIAQFASLGQFIQAFETIVDVIRRHCIDMTLGFQRGIIVQDNNTRVRTHNQ